MRSLLTAWILTILAVCSVQAQRVPVQSTVTGSLGDAGIHESSGVAVSRHHPDLLWTHNDSGADPLLYAIDWSGRLVATYRVVGARAVDWEDLALGPCPDPDLGRACLFIADTGDNSERRDDAVIYVVPEPDPGSLSSSTGYVVAARALHVEYDDGPRDAEALAVLPDGRVMLFSKGRSGPILRYSIEPRAFASESLVLTAPDTIAIDPQPLVGRWVTGAAISPSGDRAVLGTHTELYFFDRTSTKWQREGEGCWLGVPLRQWEAVDWIDERNVVVTSERAWGREGVVRTLRCF